MVIRQPQTGYAPMQRQRKQLFPFKNGMRSSEFQGVGANRAENVWFEDGRLKKMYGEEVFKALSSVDGIVFLSGYQKDDGTHQVIYCFKESAGVYRFRVLDEDGNSVALGVETITTGSGTVDATKNSPDIVGTTTSFTSFFTEGNYIDGMGDGRIYKVIKITDDTHLTLDRPYEGTTITSASYRKVINPGGLSSDISFDSSEFDFETVLNNGFLSNYSSSNYLHRWNGESLAVVQSATPYIRGVARDGKRLAIIAQDGAEFSQDAPDTVFRGGVGVTASGTYNTSIRSPRAILTAGVGVVIIGDTGSESHKVIPNNASDDVSADTKIDGYNDKEHGVDMAKKATMGKSFIWRVTPKGIMRTNPFNGETMNVTDVGKVRRYFDELWDTSNAAISYDETNEQIVCALKEGAQNDVLVCIDVTKEDMPISIKTQQYYSCLASINNKMYGGGSRDGVIDKLFTGQTNREQKGLTFKYITEWDELTNQMYWKLFKRLHIAANLSPNSSMTVKIYFDGATTPRYIKTFTTKDVTSSAGVDAPYGLYLFAGGAVDMGSQNTDVLGENKVTKRFSTVCVEVYENSGEPFELYDMILEYKTKNKFYHGGAHKNVLFT